MPTVLVVVAATGGLLATGFEGAGSIVLACAVAATLAALSAALATPPLLVLAGGIEGSDVLRPRIEQSSAARAGRTVAGWLAAGRWRAALAALFSLLVLLAAAAPLRDARAADFSAADLPGDAQARDVLEDVPGGAAQAEVDSGGALTGDLPLAGAICLVALALTFTALLRSLRGVPLAVSALLPAAATAGLCVFVFQEGHLADFLGQTSQGAIETGAMASLLAALAALGAARALATLDAVRGERVLGIGSRRAAEMAAALTVPAGAAATLIGAAAAGVLVGSDLYAAREFGLAVAVGLVLDFLLLRSVGVAALARGRGKRI
jgi:uncharacterized membrane protein YdfJ with MMPL/SSD domain